MNIKMLLAPILAFTLALLLAGAVVSFWPANQVQLDSSAVYTSGMAPPMPTAAPSAADIYFLPSLFIIPAIAVVGVAVVVLFFRKEP